jgi:hypothetical protein
MKVLDVDEGNELKPSTCYAEFCSKWADVIVVESTRLIRAHSEHPATPATSTDAATVVSDKLKATYKNRMFLIKRAHE